MGPDGGGVVNGRVVHVEPSRDLIAHDTSTEEADCICGPRWEQFQYDDAPDGWAIVHNSLDGREQHEDGRP